MEDLFKNGKFAGQQDLGWTFSFDANGKYPIIANRIFEKYVDASAFIEGPTAIPGLILRVVDDSSANGAYLVEKNGDTLKLNRIMTGDIDIQLTVVWAKEVPPESGNWVECDKTDPAAVQCLKLTHAGTNTYIPLSKILVLDDYAKIKDVDASLQLLNSSINTRFTAVDSSIFKAMDLIDSLAAITEEKFEDVNIRLDELDDIIVDLSTYTHDKFDEVTVDLSGLHNNVSSIDSRVSEIENSYVKSVKVETETEFVHVTPVASSTGDVTLGIDLSIADISTADAEHDGLATALNVKEYVSNRISEIKQFKYQVVDSSAQIPVNESGMYIIWLVKDPKRPEGNVYEEYVVVKDESVTPAKYKLEKIGDTKVDLSDYAKIADVNASLAIRDINIANNRQKIADLSVAFDDFKEAVGERIADLSIDLDEFKAETAEAIEFIDASMLVAFNHMSSLDTSVNVIERHIVDINEHLSDVDSSITRIKNHIAEIDVRINRHDERLATIDSSIANLEAVDEVHDVRLDTLDSSVNTIEETLKHGVVTSVKASTSTEYITVTPVTGTTGNVTVTVDASVCDNYSETTVEDGLTTANYIEERLSWIELD